MESVVRKLRLHSKLQNIAKNPCNSDEYTEALCEGQSGQTNGTNETIKASKDVRGENKTAHLNHGSNDADFDCLGSSLNLSLDCSQSTVLLDQDASDSGVMTLSVPSCGSSRSTLLFNDGVSEISTLTVPSLDNHRSKAICVDINSQQDIQGQQESQNKMQEEEPAKKHQDEQQKCEEYASGNFLLDSESNAKTACSAISVPFLQEHLKEDVLTEQQMVDAAYNAAPKSAESLLGIIGNDPLLETEEAKDAQEGMIESELAVAADVLVNTVRSIDQKHVSQETPSNMVESGEDDFLVKYPPVAAPYNTNTELS